MKKIAGIDVSRGSVTVCVLSEIPEDLRKFKRSWKALKFKADKAGIAALLALEFDCAVLEPTGGHYSKIWAHHLERSGREVRWVGHWEVAYYRKSWREFNKDDKIDAIVLACYGLERWNKGDHHFIQPSREPLKDLYLQMESLNRAKSPVINRLRQQLCHEFPEVAKRAVRRPWMRQSAPGLWRAIAGEQWSEKWRKEYAQTVGTGLSEFSQYLAGQLCEIEHQEAILEQKIDQELQRDDFKFYIEVFARYGITERTAAALLATIYPIEQFLDDGKLRREHVETASGKRASRDRSLASFKLACGLGMIWYQSGDKQGWTAGGDKGLRVALWRWCKTIVVISQTIDLPKVKELKDYYDQDSGVRNQKIQRVVRRMLTMLFRDLVRHCL